MKNLSLIICFLIFSQITAYSQSCLPDGITFTTQAEIDNFQTNYPTCTEIEGEVTIVTGDMNPSPITNLNGLSILIAIGGSLAIKGNDSLTSLTGLSNVTSIDGNLEIWGNYILTSLTGLESIAAGSIDNIYIEGNHSLTTCEVQSICDYLASPNGIVDIYNNAPDCNSPAEVASACGIILSCLPYGNYYFFNQTEIDNFQTNYPNCTDLQGTVKVSADDITNLDGLGVLTSITGNLEILSNNSLTSLSGLENLASIEGDIAIGGNDALTSLTGLESLSSIDGNLSIGYGSWAAGYDGNALLVNLSGMSSLSSIEGSLSILSNDAITSLTGLENLTFIGGDIVIGGNDSLTSLTGLESLTSVEGSIIMNSFYNPVGYEGNAALVSLTGLDNINTIGGSLFIASNDALINMTGLENLTSIGGSLNYVFNDALTSFTGLENLTSIGGYLSIKHNNALTSLTGLNNIDAGSIETLLTINNNPSLSTCEVQSICDFLKSPNGDITIHDNAPGCNNQEEVEEACAITIVEEINGKDKNSIYPNPVKGIAAFSSVKITSFEIYDMMGAMIIRRNSNTIDMSIMNPGIYFAIGFDKHDYPLYKGKIIKK